MPAERVLIVALSGRALAESARRAGFAPVVLDAFGDLDTRAAAVASARVPLRPDWRFEPEPLLEAAATLAPRPIPLLCGAGFEAEPELLGRLARGRELLGCDGATVRAAKNPLRFARLCRRLAVPHPDSRLAPPDQPDGWVAKRAGAAGGGHVRPAEGLAAARGRYFQRRVPGEPVAALLLADGLDAAVLGFSVQWLEPSGPGRAARFAGCAVPAPLAVPMAAELSSAARALARALGLRGLASADFLVEGERWHLLEVNPRPGASLEAWELATGASLVARHVDACRGALDPTPLRATAAAATTIVFSPVGTRIPAPARWPDWVGDRGPPDSLVEAGGPLCTVRARGPDLSAARRSARLRRAAILARFADRSVRDDAA